MQHYYDDYLWRLKHVIKLCKKFQSISVFFLEITKPTDFRWKIVMSAELKWCATWFIYFLDLLYARRNCTKFYHCRMCATNFREGWFFWSHPSWAALKNPILNRVLKSFKKPKENNSHIHILPANLLLTHAIPLIYTSWKHQKNQEFSDVFRGYRQRALTEMD